MTERSWIILQPTRDSCWATALSCLLYEATKITLFRRQANSKHLVHQGHSNGQGRARPSCRWTLQAFIFTFCRTTGHGHWERKLRLRKMWPQPVGLPNCLSHQTIFVTEFWLLVRRPKTKSTNLQWVSLPLVSLHYRWFHFTSWMKDSLEKPRQKWAVSCAGIFIQLVFHRGLRPQRYSQVQETSQGDRGPHHCKRLGSPPWALVGHPPPISLRPAFEVSRASGLHFCFFSFTYLHQLLLLTAYRYCTHKKAISVGY